MKIASLWFTRVEAAKLCGIGDRQFDKAVRPLLAPKAMKGTGRTLRFHGPGVVAAMVAYRIELAKPTLDEMDPLLVGGVGSGGSDSPALEEYRRTKTELLKRELAEVDSLLVRRPLLADALRQGIAALRGTGDRLARLYGNEAGDIYNEGVGEFEAAAGRVFGELGGDGKDGADEATED